MLDEIKAAEHALLRAHAALKQAARVNGGDIEKLFEKHELLLRRLASDLNEAHFCAAEEEYLAEREAE